MVQRHLETASSSASLWLCSVENPLNPLQSDTWVLVLSERTFYQCLVEFKNSLYSQNSQASFFLSHSLNFNLSEPVFYHFCKTILNGGKYITIAQTPIHKLGFLQNPFLSLSLKCNYILTTANQQPFSVSYHINTLGFLQEAVLSDSKYVYFKTPEKANSVVNFFQNHGVVTWLLIWSKELTKSQY